MNSRPLADRFWEKVRIGECCWEWTASRRKHPRSGIKTYGIIFHNGKCVDAHRASWEMHFGNIPNGLFVLHRCDNTACVRPDHLFLGSQADNVRDMDSKGRRRSNRGEAHFRTKITREQMLRIRERMGKENWKVLAAEFGLSAATLYKIKHGQTWKG